MAAKPGKSANPPSPLSTPPLGSKTVPSSKKSQSPATNRKSVKLDAPTSFTIDVNQIAAARNKLKNVGKAPTADGVQQMSMITIEAPEKQGNLRILSSGSWEQRWCVLKEGRLFIFANQKAPIPETILSLNGSRVGEKKHSGVDDCFQIVTTGGETLVFSAEDDYDYITWIVALRGATFYLQISTFVIESPVRTAQSVTSPTGNKTPTLHSPNGSPQIPRIETTPASPATKRIHSGTVSKSQNFDGKTSYRNSADISKLHSKAPESLSASADKFSPYRRSADISKLSKSMDNYTPLTEAISAAYRKSPDFSKLHIQPPASPHNLFSSAEIIEPHKEEDSKGGRKGLLGMPGGMFSKWKQRWVVLTHESMYVYKHEEDEDKKEPVHHFELVFCQPKVVKSEKGKYVFEIHAPGRTIQLCAPTSVDLLDWIHAIQVSQTTLMQSYLQYNLNGGGEDPEKKEQLDVELEKSKKKLSNIMQSNGNNVCADCGAEDPIWASINWGVFICIECSGVHRQMGTHISKVRSVTMDKWDADVLEFMESNGNAKVNAELEDSITSNFTKITPTSSRHDREAYIKAKYEEKLFCKKSDQPAVV